MSFPVKKLRDSLDDEDVSDDVDDEVFIRDGRTFKLDDDRGLKRPLMAPRRKFKSTSSYFSYGDSSSFKKLRVPFCYTLLCVVILCCLIALALILINMNTNYMLNKLLHSSSENPSSEAVYKPCTDYEIEELWHHTIPKIKSETPVRSVDVNGDGVEDIIVGYGTGADQLGLPSFTCQMYFGLPEPCAGGVLALDGKTGSLLWQEWLKRSVLKLDCGYDVTQDDVKDCLVSGESGLLCIINGKIGRITWCLAHNEVGSWRAGGLLLDFYAGQFIPDVDGDGVVDVMSAHTNGSSATMMGSHVVILSGATGQVLQRLNSIVSGEMMLTSPHILVRPDGESVAIFCTVHNNSPTSIYVVSLSDLMTGDPSLVKTIYSDIEGLSATPILIDMNDDHTEDIVVTSRNKLLVFNGLNYSLVLNVSYPFDDSYEHDIQFSPVPGYFNNDTTPDFFVTYSVGSAEFLYYSVSTVLDGKTGRSLLPSPIIRSNIPDAAGITLSSVGYGNDAFLYWMSSCVSYETNQEDYKLSGRSYEVDICNARFNTSTEIKLMLLSQHVASPGIVLYSSSANFETEINGTANVFEQVEEFIKLHPDVKEKLEFYQVNRLASSPAKCTAALLALQRNEASDYYVPNGYDTEMIPDPVPRSFPRERFPMVDVDALNPEFQPVGAEFPSVDDPSRDRDERADSGKADETEAVVKTKNHETGADENLDSVKETFENSEKSSVNTVVDLSDSSSSLDRNPQETNENLNESDKVNDKTVGSKEVMPRKKRSSNARVSRSKRSLDYEYDSEWDDRENKIDRHKAEDDVKYVDNIDAIGTINDIKNVKSVSYGFGGSRNGIDNSARFGKTVEITLDDNSLEDDGERNQKVKNIEEYDNKYEINDENDENNFDQEKTIEAQERVIAKNDKVLTEEKTFYQQKYGNEIDDNHGGEEFDDYPDETENEFSYKVNGKQPYENFEIDENHGGELIDEQDNQNLKEERIRHVHKDHTRRGNKEKDTVVERKDIEDYVNDEKYNYAQYLKNQDSSEGQRKKRNKLRDEVIEEADEDNDEDNTDDSEDDDNDDDDDSEEGDDEEVEATENEKGEIPERTDDEESSDGENKEEEDDSDDEEDNDENEDEDDEPNVEDQGMHENEEYARRNSDSNGKRLVRKRRSISPNTAGLGRHANLPRESRNKYFHGLNHKKKISMQEKWWKYIMLTNSEDWQVKKKNILREENKLKEERRKLEERQGNVEGSYRIENRTKELEKRSQQLKEEEEDLMKHIPSKKIVNLDEQFLNYVKKSLGLKNNDSSISNYDVDDVEQLWEDFIETNVLNHRGSGDDYEFDNFIKDKDVIDLISKDDAKKKRTELEDGVDDGKSDESSKHMVSYNLHADSKESKPINSDNSIQGVLTSQNNKLENHLMLDKNDLQQKIKHYTTLDQLKLINRIKNNKTKHNRLVKNNVDTSSISANAALTDKKLSEDMEKNIKNLKVILKNGENFKYNDYNKWRDNNEYVNFDSHYNILKNSEIGESSEVSDNISNKKNKNHSNIQFNNTVFSPQKLFLQNNKTLACNSYYFKRRPECVNDVKTKNKHTTRKQKVAKKIRKKLHEKIQTNLGIKHIVVNNTKHEGNGRAIVIEKINYKFPYNFGKEKIYSEKDIELIFNNETHAEIKKIMKLNLRKINDSITKIKNTNLNGSHHHWSKLNYYKSHKLIRENSEEMSNKYNRASNEHTTESVHTNKTTKDLWFNTLHNLKNKQFLKHLKSISSSNRAGEDGLESDFNHITLPSEQNADLITKKIDLQNNMEKIHISELKNSKNRTNKLFPYRRRDKSQDKLSSDNRIENLFGLTDTMMAKKINETGNKTENTVLGLPVGGKFASHLNWHEKTKYGLPLRNKWETTTEILANSQRHHRLLKVKKRSIDALELIASETRQSNQTGNSPVVKESHTLNFNQVSKFRKRSTVKKDLSVTLKASSSFNETSPLDDPSIEFRNVKPIDIVDNAYDINVDKNKHRYEILSSENRTNNATNNKTRPLNATPVKPKETPSHTRTSNEKPSPPLKTPNSASNGSPLLQTPRSPPSPSSASYEVPFKGRGDIVKRSVEKYLRILPRAASTPILSTSISNDSRSIDIVFVTFWVPPKSDVKKLTKTQQDCVSEKVLRAKSINCYNEFDDLLIGEEMAKQCINLDDGGNPEGNIQYNQFFLQGDAQSQLYNPFNLRFGQLSIYRVRIKCKQCAAAMFEMMHNQGWPAGAGQMSNGVFVQKHRAGQ